MTAFYVNGLLRSLYFSLTSIFVPLYIYGLGRETYGQIQTALLLTAGYFVVQRVVVALAVFPLSRLIEKMGFRRSITLSAVVLLLYTLALMGAEESLVWLWVSAVCLGINTPLYWISRDSALSQDVTSGTMGTKMAYVGILDRIAGLIGPVTGGVIVALSGYNVLFWLATGVLALSTLPLWWMPPHRHKNGVSLAGFGYFLTNGRYSHQAIANFGSAMNDYGGLVIWPLILFLQGINDESLGAIYSLAAAVTIVVQLWSGRWFDKLRSRKDYADEGVYGLASVGVALSWIGRNFAAGMGQVLAVDMGRQLFATLSSNFFSDYAHLGGKRMGSIAYWVYMEIVYSLGAIVILGVMAAGVFIGAWKEVTLMTIAIWSLAMVASAKESNLS